MTSEEPAIGPQLPRVAPTGVTASTGGRRLYSLHVETVGEADAAGDAPCRQLLRRILRRRRYWHLQDLDGEGGAQVWSAQCSEDHMVN